MLVSSICFQLAGIVQPNSCSCHLDKKGHYIYAPYEDYPSVSQLNAMALEKNAIVIFAVTEDQKHIYEKLAAKIEGADTVVLSPDASNVVEIIKKSIEVS